MLQNKWTLGISSNMDESFKYNCIGKKAGNKKAAFTDSAPIIFWDQESFWLFY